MAKALDGLKVLDFTRMYAGPFCTMLLGELGAEVIKVEIPVGGDAVRTTPPLTEGGESHIFTILNRGKKSITLNLGSEKGCELARELAKWADVVVENFTPGVMDRLGLGYEELRKVNPRLIFASISGFGHTGPRSSQPAFDLVAQAMGGLTSVTGFPHDPPTKAGPAIADFSGALYTVISILAALQYRWKTGEGQMVDISLQDCIWALTAIEHLPFYLLTGRAPQRHGNSPPAQTPFGIYPAKNGYVVVAVVTIGQWEGFLRVVGREDLIGDERYFTQAQRLNYRDEMEALVEEWTRKRSVEEILNELGNASVPCSPVPAFDEVANDPQLAYRGMTTDVEQLISGKVKVPGSIFKLSETPGDAKSPAPFLGQHNYEVYSNLLGYSEQEIGEFADAGIV